MPATPALALSLVLAQAPASPKSKEAPKAADRSAEPELRSLLKAMGSLRGASFEVMRQDQDEPGGQLSAVGQALYEVRDPLSFRIQYQGAWGDALLVIRQKDLLLVDPMEKGASAVLSRAPSKPDEFWKEARTENQVGIAPLFLSGEDSLPLLAPPSGRVVLAPAAKNAPDESLKVIETTGSRFGRLTIGFLSRPALRLAFVEKKSPFASLAGRETVVKWGRLARRPAAAFLASPERGVSVEDRRKGQVSLSLGGS